MRLSACISMCTWRLAPSASLSSEYRLSYLKTLLQTPKQNPLFPAKQRQAEVLAGVHTNVADRILGDLVSLSPDSSGEPPETSRQVKPLQRL